MAAKNSNTSSRRPREGSGARRTWVIPHLVNSDSPLCVPARRSRPAKLLTSTAVTLATIGGAVPVPLGERTLSALSAGSTPSDHGRDPDHAEEGPLDNRRGPSSHAWLSVGLPLPLYNGFIAVFTLFA